MSDPLPVILLVAGIIAVIVLIEAFLLLIPARLSLSFRSRESEKMGVLVASWSIFGIEVLVAGKDPQLSVMAGGMKLVTRPLSSFITPGKEDEDNGPGPGQVPGIISSLLRLQGPLLAMVMDLFRHTRLDYMRGTARVGLEDPAATGMLYGLYRALIVLFPQKRVNFVLLPDFSREVCEIDITTRIRITFPVLVLVNAVKIVKHPAARKVMKTMNRKKAGDVAA
ncbi:MAG: DUF2953 domain-containing protein [Methanomicrobiales archaeon]